MSNRVDRVNQVIAASSESREAAAPNAVKTAARTARELRIAEATRFDVTVDEGMVVEYRVGLGVSFTYAREC